MKFPIIPGTRFNIQIGYKIESGIVKELISELSDENGSVLKKKPRMIGSKMSAVILVKLDNRNCMETVNNFECYARIQILHEAVTMAFGKVIELID